MEFKRYVFHKLFKTNSTPIDLFNSMKKTNYFSDTRLDHLPFRTSPLPMLILVFIYVFMVQNGKKWMKNRQPMQIDQILIAYNLIQIIINFVGMLLVRFLFIKIYCVSEIVTFFHFLSTGNALHLFSRHKF